MEHRQLGRTGVSVSKFCLGAMMFGAWGNPDHDESIRIIHTALDAGINFIDTADVYGQGESEEIVGKALAGGRRDDVILATKFHNAMGEDPNQQGNARRWIIRAVEDSLRRLGTDWIDLYQAHRLDPRTDVEETLSALSELVHQGKVRYIGTSTFPASHIVEARWLDEPLTHERGLGVLRDARRRGNPQAPASCARRLSMATTRRPSRAAHARATVSPSTRSSWRTCPNVNAPQERSQRRRRDDAMIEHLAGPAGAQHDAVEPGQRGAGRAGCSAR